MSTVIMVSRQSARVAPDWELPQKDSSKAYPNYPAYFMLFCGALPGSAVVIRSRSRRIFFNVLNAFCLLIVTARLVLVLSTGWTNAQDDSLEVFVYKANFAIWMALVMLQAYALAFTSYRYSGAFHESYDRAVKHLKELQIEVDWKKERKLQVILLVMGLLANFTVASITMSTFDSLDPFFGNSRRNQTTPEVFSALYYFGWPTLLVYSIYSTSFTIYIVSIAKQTTSLLTPFNKKLSSELESSGEKALPDLRRYRRAHCLLSKVVNEADNKLSLNIGLSLLFSTIMEFLIIFILSSRARTFSEFLSIVTWVLMGAATVFIVIITGHRVREKVYYQCAQSLCPTP